MVLEKQKQSIMEFSFKLNSIYRAPKNVTHLLGDSVSAIINKVVGDQDVEKRINITISELLSNVFENSDDSEEGVDLKLKIRRDSIKIDVSNKILPDQYQKIKDHIQSINQQNDPMTYLSQTLKQNRKAGINGGLGLIRLVSEERARLKSKYYKDKGWFTISAILPVGEVI